MTISVDELLAGGSLKHEVEIPYDILNPNGEKKSKGKLKANNEKSVVILKPLTVRDIQLITKASRENEALISALVIQKGLVEPSMDQNQINSMHAGLIKFLNEKIQEISGMATNKDSLNDMVQAPLSRACFVLAKEFGWTPQEVSEMTIGQILLYIEMLNNGIEKAKE